jgi:hypothetical protein
MRFATAVLLLGLVCAAAGCGNKSENLVPVAGKVTVAGKVLATGTVSFRPDAAKGNASMHQPTGTIESDGSYQLYVTGGRAGAPPGWYKVVVTAYDDPAPGKPLKSFASMDYADEKKTPLRVEVSASAEAGRYDLKLAR